MSTITMTWSQVLVIALAAIGVYVAELLSFMRSTRRQAELDRRTHERLSTIASQLAAAQEKLEKLEKLASSVEGIRQVPQAQGSYGEAVQLAERGLDAAAVAAKCGISRTEADLIVALSRSRAA